MTRRDVEPESVEPVEVSRDSDGMPTSVAVGRRDADTLLTLPQNVNDGWTAHLDGKTLTPQTRRRMEAGLGASRRWRRAGPPRVLTRSAVHGPARRRRGRRSRCGALRPAPDPAPAAYLRGPRGPGAGASRRARRGGRARRGRPARGLDRAGGVDGGRRLRACSSASGGSGVRCRVRRSWWPASGRAGTSLRSATGSSPGPRPGACSPWQRWWPRSPPAAGPRSRRREVSRPVVRPGRGASLPSPPRPRWQWNRGRSPQARDVGTVRCSSVAGSATRRSGTTAPRERP